MLFRNAADLEQTPVEQFDVKRRFGALSGGDCELQVDLEIAVRPPPRVQLNAHINLGLASRPKGVGGSWALERQIAG